MKDLPKVYASPINKELKNNREVYDSSVDLREDSISDNILVKINEIFASPHHVYKSKVHIKTKNEEIDTVIVGKVNDYLLTLDGDKIRIGDIKTIERI